MIIYRPDSISDFYGVTVPSITMISYGSMGHVPTMAAYLSEDVGLLIIPINLIVTLIVSALVGFNTALSAYAFAGRPKKSIKYYHRHEFNTERSWRNYKFVCGMSYLRIILYF
jgi:hypothetical protein